MRTARPAVTALAAGLAVLVLVPALGGCAGGGEDGAPARRDAANDRPYREHRVPRGRYHLYARDYPGEEPALVLMHGFPDNHRLYDRLVPELNGRHGRRVIVFDFLGWGDSDKPQDHTYTFAGQQADVDAVVRYFHLDRVSLVAHDAAGPGATNWALDHPDRTAALTLMNAFYAPAPTLRPPALIALLQLGHLDAPILGVDLAGSLEPLGREIVGDSDTFRHLFRWQERQFFARRADAEHFIPLFLRQFDGRDSSRAPLLSLAADAIPAVAANAGRLDELAAFPRPIRLIWGDRDPDLNTDIARALHEAVPASELLVVPEARHNLQIDEPRRVADLLLG
jgi:pimeloyl-ACP methyl ester carboxylesterase